MYLAFYAFPSPMAMTSFMCLGPRIPTTEEMDKENIAYGYRDRCVGLLIKLKHCELDNWFIPYRCAKQRHKYEKCQYYE